MPGPCELGNSCALSQASENARVIVRLLQETSAEWRKCADFLHFFLCGSRIANRCSSALNPAIQGVLQQFNFWGNCLSGSLPFLLWFCLLWYWVLLMWLSPRSGLLRFSSSCSFFCFFWLFWDTSSVAPKQSSNRIYQEKRSKRAEVIGK